MFRRFLLLTLFAVFLGVSAIPASAQGTSRIDRQVRKEILTLPYYGVFDAIGYETNAGTVILNGYVMRPTTRRDAEESVRDVDGVVNVINNIEVLPPSPADDRIRNALLRTMVNRGGSLYRYFMGANPSIRLIVNRGRVSLEGFVDRKGDSDLAYILARGVGGTFGVTNNLKVIGEPR